MSILNWTFYCAAPEGVCNDNPCVHGYCYTSEDIVHFECRCEDGWTGGICDIPQIGGGMTNITVDGNGSNNSVSQEKKIISWDNNSFTINLAQRNMSYYACSLSDDCVEKYNSGTIQIPTPWNGEEQYSTYMDKCWIFHVPEDKVVYFYLFSMDPELFDY